MFSPNNTTIYLRAFAGALGGLGGGGRWITDSNPGDYYLTVLNADGFAQAVDVQWGSSAPTNFELIALEDLSSAIWARRSPIASTSIPTIVSNLNQLAIAVCALVRAGNGQVVEEGVDPSQTGGSSAAGSTNSANVIRFVIGTAATYQSTANIPANAFIQSTSVEITTPYVSGSTPTIEVGQGAAPALLQATTDNLPTAVATYTNIYQDAVWGGAATPVLVTIGGAPSAGAGVVTVVYAVPLV